MVLRGYNKTLVVKENRTGTVDSIGIVLIAIN
jgi:hypothetical protein